MKGIRLTIKRRTIQMAAPSNPASAAASLAFVAYALRLYDVLDDLASGMTEDEILDDFPDLTREDIKER